MNSALFYLVLIQIGFSYSYPLTKDILQFLDPIVWSTIRAAAAGAILFFVTRFMGLKEFKTKIPRWHLMLLALCGVSLNQYFFIEGLKTSAPTDAAIMATTIPIWVFLGALLYRLEKFSFQKAVGILSAIAGVLILFGRPSGQVSYYLILNGLIYSIYVVFGYRYMQKENPLLLLRHLFFYGTLWLSLLTAMKYFMGEVPLPSLQTFTAWNHLLPMIQVVLFGTLVPYFFNTFCTKRLAATVISLGITIQPPVTAFLDYLIHGTKLDPTWAVSGALVALGVFLTSADFNRLSFRKAR